MARILFVVTGAETWTLADGSTHPTGYWAEEVAVPLEVFRAAGHQVTVATPGGVVPPVDQGSLEAAVAGGPEEAARLAAVLDRAPELRAPVALADVRLEDHDALYVPGGHGPMEDLSQDPDSGRLLTGALAAGVPVSVVCHGPAALLAAVTEDGSNAFAGYRVAAFTNEEETQAGHAAHAPWLLQDRLTDAGLVVDAGAPWSPHVVVDRTVVTGQNPASSRPVALALLEQLG